MRQVIGFLNCSKKNGLSNEKYVPRKRPRDFYQAGILVVDIARRGGQDDREYPNAARPRGKGAYFVLRSGGITGQYAEFK
jgi:hypothetical protein